MSDPTPDDERRTRPFADFLAEHNKGVSHRKVSEALQEVVTAVVETGKKGSVALTVSVEPMKGAEDGTLMITVNTTSKVPVEPVKAAVFYADDEGNLTRTDPRQLSFDSLKEAPAPAAAEARELPATGPARVVGGEA